jgi:hypothetical protein
MSKKLKTIGKFALISILSQRKIKEENPEKSNNTPFKGNANTYFSIIHIRTHMCYPHPHPHPTLPHRKKVVFV